MDEQTARLADPGYRRELGNGLVLRWSAAADSDALGALTAQVFGRPGAPAAGEGRWTRELISGRHPLCGPGEWALVEDTARGVPVATTGLMRHTWTYDGIPFEVGRPEQVVTLPGYRDRGLIRAIFGLLHARSAAHGHRAQVIDGIPYFYRQFGYEYAVDGYGGRSVYLSAIPDLPASEAEPYGLRDATPDDVPLLERLYRREQADALVAVEAGAAYWRWVLSGQDHSSELGWRPLVIGDASATAVGYLVLREGACWQDDQALAIPALAVLPEVPLRRVLPSVLRGLKALVPELPSPMVGTPPLRLLFLLGRDHPVYTALDFGLLAHTRRPYAWYVRVPDLAAFLRHVAPALERRLAGSVFAGVSCALGVTFYRGQLELRVERGRVTQVDEWPSRAAFPLAGPRIGAGLPRGQFLQLLFGYRSFEELRDTQPDVWANDEEVRLLETLFLKRLSRPVLLN